MSKNLDGNQGKSYGPFTIHFPNWHGNINLYRQLSNLQIILYPSPMKNRLLTLPFDQLMDQQVGFGNRQRSLSCAIYILLLSEGIESVIITILLPLLLRQWAIESFKLAIITFIFLGITLGSYLQYVADSWGRKYVLELAAMGQAIFGLLSCFSYQYYYFICVRFLFGIGIGVVFPLSGTYLAQISPSALRIHTLGWSRIFFSLGSAISCIIAWIFLEDSKNINKSGWRSVLLLSILPGVISLIMLRMRGFQSPRYLLVKGHFDDGVKTVELMMERRIQLDDKLALLSWARLQNSRQQYQTSWLQLFCDQYLKKTVVLGITWISTCVCYYNLSFIMPLLLHDFQKDVKYMLLLIFYSVQILSTFLSVELINHLGRRNSLILFCFVSCFAYFMLQLLRSPSLHFLMFAITSILLRFTTIALFIALYPYTTETYHTLLRSKSMSFLNVISRMSVAVLGIFLGWLLQQNLVFVIVGLSPLVAGLGLWSLNNRAQQMR